MDFDRIKISTVMSSETENYEWERAFDGLKHKKPNMVPFTGFAGLKFLS